MKKRSGKYNAKPQVIDGHRFASKKEALVNLMDGAGCMACGSPKNSRRLYCSHRCANIASGPVRMRRVSRTCSFCGRDFEVRKSYPKTNCCSRYCFHQSQRKLTPLKCLICQSSFQPNCSKRRYCSVKCARIGHRGPMTEEKKERVRMGMAKSEVRQLLRNLNSRSRRPMSEDHKAALSAALGGRMPKNTNRPFGNVKSGYYDINGRKMYFRSKWEANYALYLDWMLKEGSIEKWEYEAKTFFFEAVMRGTRTWKPDFRVTRSGKIEYHEVKGWATPRFHTQMKRMAKYHPSENIVVIDKAFYLSMLKSRLCQWFTKNPEVEA